MSAYNDRKGSKIDGPTGPSGQLCSRCQSRDVKFSLRYRHDGRPCTEPEEREPAHHITYYCGRCYEAFCARSKLDDELERRMQDNPQWLRQDGESRSEYHKRMMAIWANMGGVRRMPT